MIASRAGAVIILAMVLVYLICRLFAAHIGLVSRAYHREKNWLIRSRIADSLEESAPIHLDIGNSNEGSLAGGAVLSAAAATETVSAQMAYADEPWVITGSGGLTAVLEKDAVRLGMDAADYGSSFDTDCAVYTGASGMEHIAGNAAALEKAPSALHLSMGGFGPAAALTDTLCRKDEVLMVGGDDLLSQAVGTVSADAVFVGEQFTEIPDSLKRTEKKDPALLAMDILRWVIIAAIAAFAAMGLNGF